MQLRDLLRRSWFLSWGERPVLDLKGVHLKGGEQMLELGIHLFKNQEHWSYFLPWQSLPTGQLCRNRRGTSPQYQNRYLDLVVCYKFQNSTTSSIYSETAKLSMKKSNKNGNLPSDWAITNLLTRTPPTFLHKCCCRPRQWTMDMNVGVGRRVDKVLNAHKENGRIVFY